MIDKKYKKKAEQIMIHAVALNQSGRLKNIIMAKDRYIYIVNGDYTVLLRFDLGAPAIKTPFAFNANDYDGMDFHEEDGKIAFTFKAEGMKRTKCVGIPTAISLEEVEDIFEKHGNRKFRNIVNFHENHLSLFEDNLSHIEIKSENKEVKFTQRDIITGSTITLERIEEGFGMGLQDEIVKDFGPIALRTQDFAALFTFNPHVEFRFPSLPEKGICLVKGSKLPMEGIVAFCVYDEMGGLTVVK